MNGLLDLPLRQRLDHISFGKGIPEDLQEAATETLKEAPRRIAFAEKMLATPDQREDFYTAWRVSLYQWRRAMHVCDPKQNLYLKE